MGSEKIYVGRLTIGPANPPQNPNGNVVVNAVFGLATEEGNVIRHDLITKHHLFDNRVDLMDRENDDFCLLDDHVIFSKGFEAPTWDEAVQMARREVEKYLDSLREKKNKLEAAGKPPAIDEAIHLFD